MSYEFLEKETGKRKTRKRGTNKSGRGYCNEKGDYRRQQQQY